MAAADLPADYPELRDLVRELLAEGQVQTGQSSKWHKVQTYWHVGDALHSRVFAHDERAAYGERIVATLSRDVDLRADLLWDVLRFRRTITTLGQYAQLSWSHYRELMRLPTGDQRHYYEREANQYAWTVPELKDQIASRRFEHVHSEPDAIPEGADPFAGRPLRARKGSLFTYRVIEDEDGILALDLGFETQCGGEHIDLDHLRVGTIVRVTKNRRATKFPYRLEATRARRRFTYRARIRRVIDGDTVVARIDFGFDFHAIKRLRLRGIDTPKLATRAGTRAREYVEQAIDHVDFVVVTTSNYDLYGRTLADLYYLPGEPDPEVVLREGHYLNRELLEHRLATRYV